MREPLFRKTFDAASLLREHPPQFRHPHKTALFAMAYPDGSASPTQIEVTRWREDVDEPISLSTVLKTEVQPNFYDYEPIRTGTTSTEWHVNFADPRLFCAYASALFAQDEIQVAEHPLLACIREALLFEKIPAKTSDETGATPILVRNVERRLAISTIPNAAAGRPFGIYGNRFAEAPLDVIKGATRRIDPATYTHLIAMAAPAGGSGDYTEHQIESIFATAYTAFSAAMHESAGPAVIHSGFWGCGAFGGNRTLMIALQALAARAASVSHLVIHAGASAGAADAQRGLEVGEIIAERCGSTCSLDTLVGRALILGYRWGVSDGN
jgi:hypothetical protein